MIRYEVVHARTLEALARRVSRRIHEGWSATGGVAVSLESVGDVSAPGYLQAVTLTRTQEAK